MYTDLRDFEAEVTFRIPKLYRNDKDVYIHIEKSGGGTVGDEYTGTWRYVIDYDGTERIYCGQDFKTPMPYTHESAARDIVGWLGVYGGSANSGYEGDNMPTGDALKMCQDNTNRFNLFSDAAIGDETDATVHNV